MSTLSAQRSAVLRQSVLWGVVPALLLLLSVSTGCISTGTNPVSGNTRAYGYTWQEEVKLGAKADEQIQNQYGVYDDKQLQQYVDEVAQEVLAESHLRRSDTEEQFRETEFHFRVLDSPTVNAFALPGGYVYLTRGLLAHLNNEAQMAVVLGHEIAHVAARHASQQAARQQLTKGLLLGGAIAGQVAFGGNVGENVLGIGGTAAQLLSLSYSRDNERESDRLGVQYAVRAGYDAAEGANFFETLERMQEQSEQSIPTWQSTHPDPGAREQNIPQIAQKWKKKIEGTQSMVDQEDYYNGLANTILGNNPRQGFAEGGVFYHPELAFRFSIPSEWTVQNQPRQVAIIHPDQEAYMVFGFAEGDTPEAAARKFAGQEGLSVLERQSTAVNGYDARRVLAEGKTQKGQVVRLLVYFIAYDENVYQFQGATSAEQYSTYRGTFRQSIESFNRLTDSQILNVEPTRLAIRSAGQRAAFRAFVNEGDLPEGMTNTDLAILNQLTLSETVAEDRPLKLPD